MYWIWRSVPLSWALLSVKLATVCIHFFNFYTWRRNAISHLANCHLAQAAGTVRWRDNWSKWDLRTVLEWWPQCSVSFDIAIQNYATHYIWSTYAYQLTSSRHLAHLIIFTYLFYYKKKERFYLSISLLSLDLNFMRVNPWAKAINKLILY